MDERELKTLVQSQFGTAAQDYVTSQTHASGSDLARMVELADLRGSERVLDIATGGGHTALAFARGAREVVALDLTEPMLRAAELFVRDQGLTNISFQLGDAEALPFPDRSFDIVTCRIAPHHFPHPEQFVREAARVLCSDGRFLLDDNMAPEEPDLDTFMNHFEKWRDPSHVRAHRLSEWSRWMESAGLEIETVEPLTFKRYDFADWTARMRMEEPERAALEQWLLAAPSHIKDYFQIEQDDGKVRSLCSTFAIIVARRP